MRFTRCSLLAALTLFGCAHPLALPGLGPVRPEQLCPDQKRCDARGDHALSTLVGRKARPIYLAEGQGPESYLGKVAPERAAESALKTCGGDVRREDYHQTGPSARTLTLVERGRQQLRGALRTHLAQALAADAGPFEARELSVDKAVELASLELTLSQVGLVSQSYWLRDAAFERRVEQCGEEEYEDIVYSVTLLRVADLTLKELEARLLRGLELALNSKPEPELEGEEHEEWPPEVEHVLEAPEVHAGHAEDEAAQRAELKRIAERAVQAFAADLRIVAALGFDDR